MSPDREHKKGGEHLQKPPAKKRPGKAKPKRTPRQSVLHWAYIALTVIAAIVVVLFIAYKLAFVKPTLKPNADAKPGIDVGADVVDRPDGESAAPTKNPDRKSDVFYTFLVAGVSGGNTDVVMLASYDVTNQKLNVMNIPRDTMVNLATDLKKINAVYGVYGGDEKGIQALREFVGKTVGVTPDFYVMVEWEAVGRLATAIGGVDFEVPFNMNYDDPTQNLHIHINAGMQHLDGEGVMKVLRYRDGNNGGGYREGDIGRIKTQQALLKEIAKKLLRPATVGKIPELVNIFSENVDTDLSIQNILWLAKAAIEGDGLDVENVNFVTMPGNYNDYAWSRSTNSNQSYVTVNVDELLELVNADFNPYKEDVTAADLEIMYKNKDGTIACTSGNLRDTKANQAWLAAKNTPKATPTPSASADPEPSPSVSPNPSASPRPTGTGGTDTPNQGTPPPEQSPSDSGSGTGTNIAEPTAQPTPSPSPEPTAQPTTTPEQPPEGIPF